MNNTPMNNTPWALLRRINAWTAVLQRLDPLALLAARGYVGWVFFASGLTKLRDWESTLFLFQEEYRVPLLSPEIAAWMGTAGEMILPVLLVAGVLGRFAALGLTVVNLVAVLSLAEIAPAALNLHGLWAVLLLILAIRGAGDVSVDARWLTPAKNTATGG